MIFILLLACSVSAMTVTLTASTDGTDVNSKDVLCKVAKNATEELTSLTVWFKNNESAGWQAGASVTPPDLVDNTDKTFSLTSLVNATYTWNCLAINNETNNVGAGSNNTFKITFTTAAPAENNPPTCTIAADTNKTTGKQTGVDVDSDLSASGGVHCTDADADTISYDILTQPGVGTFILTGANLSAYSSDTSTGMGYATINVSDESDGSVLFDVMVNWTDSNTAPYLVKNVSNQTWNQDTNKTIDLDDYFSDAQDSSLNYSYTFTSSSPYNINVTIESDGDAIFSPEEDWTGTETLTFTAYDSENLTVTSNEVTLTVQEANGTNSKPVIDSKVPITNPTITVNGSQTFSITKSDPDGDDLNVTWYVENVIQEGKIGDSFTYKPSKEGTFKIKVAVADASTSALHTWTLTVKSSTAKTSSTAGSETKKSESETKTAVCGDGECDTTGGENCALCADDCGCDSGYECNTDTGRCRKQVKTRNMILIGIIAAIFIGGAIAGLYFYRRSQTQEIFGLAKTPIQTPPKGAVKKEVVKGADSAKPGEAKPVVTAKKTAEQPLKKPKSSAQVLLKKYIQTNLRKGKSFEQIKQELVGVGWKEDQIQEAYTAAQLDESFS
ncbi:MAG: PKD domain-containing protein [Nanoarchaeota archaeon]|nr:PKD domain-containing protein [Nanoarchaeota archaeon]